MTAALRNADSGNVEYYTPPAILDSARFALGGQIDLDPFSNEKANTLVKAENFFTAEDNGLKQIWFGRVWMNPPFGKMTSQCVHKLLMEWACGNIIAACCITHANTSESWFQLLAKYPQCFLAPRTNYIDGSTMKITSGATKGSVVTYLGEDVNRFRIHFQDMGRVKV